MARIFAIGNVNLDGTIHNATPGITIDTRGTYSSDMYKVILPPVMIYHNNYVIQLTQELVDDGNQDQHFTSIGYLFKSINGFQVGIIRGNSGQYIKGCWSFVLLDL